MARQGNMSLALPTTGIVVADNHPVVRDGSSAAEMRVMDSMGAPLFQTPDEQRRLTYDLMHRILGALDQWGKAHSGKNVSQMRDMTMEALLKSITVICVHKELLSMGVDSKNVQAFFQRIYKEEPIAPEEPEMLLALRVRKDVLLRNLEKAVHAF